MSTIHEKFSGYDETTPVLIVGGSLVGLSTSLFLARHGIPSLLVESHTSISQHPRAFNFNLRTMELFRAAGVEPAIRQAQPAAYQNSGIVKAESLNGKELHWITQDTTGQGDLSPIPGSLIGQDVLEPLLYQQARALGSDIRFSTSLISFEQDADGVSAIILDHTTNTERSVRARYLVAADGNRSAIRKTLDINVHGPGTQGQQLSILFEANVQGPLRGRSLAVCFVNNPDSRQGAHLVFARNGQGFALFTPYYPEKGEQVEDFTGERGIAMVRAAIGIPDYPVKIISVTTWEVAAWAAGRFQQGRVFLVGDSAHVNPPSGAFGGNTGIADAYNLAWKLSYVLQEMAGPTLLDTYSVERQLIARHTVEQAFSMFARFSSLKDVPTVPIVPYDATAFGYRYRSDAILARDEDYTNHEDPHHPSGRPGTHAPHVVLQRQKERFSTFDLFGQHFILLAGNDGQEWLKAAQRIAQRYSLPLDAYRIGPNSDFSDPDNNFLARHAISNRGAVLIRPDGFIGWRAQEAMAHPEQILEQALSQLLARTFSPARSKVVQI